jgi:hypothetical protein
MQTVRLSFVDLLVPGFSKTGDFVLESADETARYHAVMPDFFGSYSLLALNSFGLQNALERVPVEIPHFFARVLGAAKRCVILVRDELAPKGFLKYAPDSHFVYTSYAVLSLLKVSRSSA